MPASSILSMSTSRPSARELNTTSPFLTGMAKLATLSTESQELIRNLDPLDDYRASQTIRLPRGVARGAVIGSGWAARYRLLSDGRRQIVALLLPGDMLQFGSDDSAEAQLPLTMLTRVRVLNAKPVRAAVDEGRPEHQGLTRALEKASAQSESRLVDHIVRLGAQNGIERMAHLFVELRERIGAIGLCDREEFHMPLTQECLADVLGLSIVHVNRTLQQLRREELIHLSHGRLNILKPALLQSISE